MACKHKKAIFDPTPESEQSLSTDFGTSESNSARRRCDAYRTYLDFTFFRRSQFRRGGEGGVGTNCVLQRQNPTMASAMTCSLAASRASGLSLPPSEVQRLYMAAPVILGLRREHK